MNSNLENMVKVIAKSNRVNATCVVSDKRLNAGDLVWIEVDENYQCLAIFIAELVVDHDSDSRMMLHIMHESLCGPLKPIDDRSYINWIWTSHARLIDVESHVR